MPPASDDDDWKFSLEDVSGDAEDEEEGSVFGPRPDEGREEILPGDPNLENALFVALGVAASLVLILELVGVV